MTEDDFKDRLNRFMDLFGSLTDQYEKANPEWIAITYLQIIGDALENLKRLMEDPEDKEITWELPGAELAYKIKANWEEAEPYYFDVTAEDLENPDKIRGLLGGGLGILKRLYVLRKATREILIIKKGGKYFYKVPQALQNGLDKLPEEKQIARIEKILNSISKIKRFPAIGIKGKGKAGRAALFLGIGPALIDIDKKEAYYPITIGLEFKGIRPKDLGPEFVYELLDRLIKEVRKHTPAENLDLAPPNLRPVPKADKARAAAQLVKASLHTEKQKWGHKPEPKQRGLFDALLDDTQKDIKKKSIDVFGIDITQAQEQALHAIQALLTKTNYMGNIPGTEIIDQGFHFTGYLPALEFTPAEYLEAYGLTKYQTGRGKDEYSSAERALALRALVDLARKSFLFVYKRHYWKENEKTKQREPVIDRVETIAPLIKIMRGWEALTRAEDKGLDAGAATEKTDEKLTSIAIQPAPIMVQDINSFFVLKRANYFQEIKFLAPHASKYTYRFINWLMYQAELKRQHKEPLVVKIGLEDLAYILRMDAYVKTRQFKRIGQILTKSYKIAQDLGYLVSYSTVQGQTKDLERLELNPNKYGVRAGNPGPELPKRGDNSPGGGLPNAVAGST